MKCLQKDPAKRFQSATDLEFALVKASKARRASPVEAAVNLWMDRAEVEVREIVCEAADATREYWKRQDWRALLTLQEDPKAMLGVTGIVSALSVFLLFGAWKPRTINAQPVTAGNHAAQTSAANAATPAAHAQPPAPHNSFEPIASHEVDLYGDLKAPGKKVVSSDPIPVAKELRAATVVQPTAAEPPQIAKTPKAAAPATERKPHSKAPRSIQLESPASPVQAANAVAAESATTAAAEPAADSAQPSAQPESIFPAATTILQTKAAGNDPTAPKLYVEVGSFKDETWANNAVDKLNQLGFHTQLVHKNLLWSQSYHVQVGPYADRKGVEEAQKSLTSQGFKAHPVN
jgi:cell division septation protein DedD